MLHEPETRELLFLQEAHTVSRPSDIRGWNLTITGETGKHSEDATTKITKRSETISWSSQILQEICAKTRRYIKGTDTAHMEGCRIQMDTKVPRMLHDTEGGIAKSNHPQVPDPQASYTTIHGCIKICIHRSLNTDL